MSPFEGPPESSFEQESNRESTEQSSEYPAGIPKDAVETTNENGAGTRTFRLEVKGIIGRARAVQEWILDENGTLTHTTTDFNWLGKQASVKQVTTAQGDISEIHQVSTGGGSRKQEIIVRGKVESITQKS